MKLTLDQQESGQDELVIRYSQMTDEIRDLIEYIEQKEHHLLGNKDGKQIVIQPSEVIYLESVDGTTYIYTKEEVYRTGISLMVAEKHYEKNGYFRCSKSMVLNIYRIKQLKSEPGNRIDALMDNGEHVMISRRYAKTLRSILKGGER